MDADSQQTPVVVPARVRPYTLAWLAFGVVVLAAGLLAAPPGWPPTRSGDAWWLLVGLAVVAIVLGTYGVDTLARHLKGTEGPEELVLAASLCILRPGWAVAVTLFGAVGASVLDRRGWLRFGFNLGWSAAAISAATLVYVAMGPRDPFGLVGIAAMAAAVVVFTLINWAAIAGLRQRLGDRRSLGQRFREGLAHHLVTALLAGATGLVGAALLLRAPALVPLVALPVIVHRSRLEQQEALQRARMAEHERLERTVAGASDGIALLDANGRIEVWNPTMAALTGTTAEDAIGRRADDVLAAVAESDVVPTGLCVLRSETGTLRTVSLDRSAVGGARDGDRGVVLVARDVTAQAELDRMRDDLVSRVSHELRTPLASVTGLLETVLLRWDGLDDDRRRLLLDRAQRASARLARLVSELLTHARIERVSTPVHREPFTLAATVDDLLAELRGVLDLEMVTDLDRSVVADADPGHVAQIVTGLVVNASHYGRPPVEIRVGRAGGGAVLEVRDHGTGVPDEFVPDLFTPFAQASTGLQRTAHGLGLGLSIGQRLAEANGGRLDYEPAPGSPGARFVLRLPLANRSDPGGEAAGATAADGPDPPGM